MTRVLDALKEIELKMISFRRELHKSPELSFEEVETTNRLAEKLDEYGISYKRMDPTGLVGEIKGNNLGKTVLLRADIDALPVTEKTENIDYQSTAEGKMHACGHDTHAAMLMAALVTLNDTREDIHGTIRFVFQPAEEVGTGAQAMIAQGVLEGVDQVFGVHVMTTLPTGHVACLPGPMLASSDFFTVTFKGSGGHGAMPHLSNDPVIMAANFVMSIQTAVSRLVDPLEGGVLTVGSIQTGNEPNIIPSEALLKGTVRTFYPDARDTIETAINDMAGHIAQMYKGEANVQYDRLTTVVNNLPEAAERVENIVKETQGEEYFNVISPTMAGEDFGHYTELVPGAFAFVGGYNEELDTVYPNHHECFNIDEESLIIGANLYAEFALRYLKDSSTQ